MPCRALTVANIRSYVRDRAAVFWTLAFPLIFIFMFGFIFQGGGDTRPDRRAGSTRTAPRRPAQLHAAFAAAEGLELTDAADRRCRARPACRTARSTRSSSCRPATATALAAATAGTRCAGVARRSSSIPSRQQLTAVGLPGGRQRPRRRQPRWPAAARAPAVRRPSRPRTSSFISYFVPSILGLSIMQVGIFAAVPLVADREKRILKRLAATPLRRSQLVGSNILMRLLIALVQSVIIVGVGVLVFGVEITGSLATGGRASSCSARSRSWPSATSSPRSPRPRTPPTASRRSSSSR